MEHDIEKTTITITRAASVVILIVGFTITILTQWFTTSNAMDRGFDRLENKLTIEVLKINNVLNNKSKDIETLNTRQTQLESIITQRAIQPETSK